MTEPAPRVVVYGRAHCHLCDDVYAVVAPVCAAREVAWTHVDIDSDDALRAAYGQLVPVVTVDGVTIATWRLPPGVLESHLDAG